MKFQKEYILLFQENAILLIINQQNFLNYYLGHILVMNAY